MNNHSLKEEDIRPERFKVDSRRLEKEDVDRYLLSYKSDFVKVACPACGKSRSCMLFEKEGFTYEECSECKTFYINPRPTSNLLDNYYAKAESVRHWNDFVYAETEKARREYIFRPRAGKMIALCDKHNVGRESFLEIGAGFGTFCEELQDRKAFDRVVAVEPSPILSASCRSRGVEVHMEPIERLDLAHSSFDVVASFEVIEHIFRPIEFLARCVSFLRPGGLFFLTCPNGNGFEIATLKQHSASVSANHLNYFNPNSLSYLLSRVDMDVLTIETPGKLDAEMVRKKVLAGVMDLSSQFFLKQVLLDEWDELGGRFQGFLSENLLSSHMWAVARKNC